MPIKIIIAVKRSFDIRFICLILKDFFHDRINKCCREKFI